MATTRKKPAAAKKPRSRTPVTTAPARAPAVKKAPAPPKARPAASAKAAQPAKAAKAVKAPKADKPKKPKMVRDSFTIPKAEYAVIEVLKQRSARLGRPAKKSELLRAGLKALEAMGDVAFGACVAAVPAIKTGRPAKD
jgi:hypothetical protein